MADGRVIIDTKLDTTGIEKGIRSISTLLKTDLATRALGVLKDAVSYISKETGELNDSIRMASTLFGDYNVNLTELSKNLRTLSNETQVAASELGMGLYNALSSGVPASENMAEALEFVRKNALAAKAGMAELDPTIRATASVMNSYVMTVADTDRILGVMMNTQNLGITTIRELSTTLAQVIPTAASFGVSFEQVGAALATMTAMGTQTAQATTGLNNMLSELGRQSQQAYKNLESATEAAGLGKKNFQQLTEEGYSLAEVLNLMKDYAEKNGKTLVDMFGSIEGGRAALQLTTNDGEKFVTFLESMYNTEGMVEKASKTVMTETQRLGLSIANAASSIGNKFLPAWNDVAGKLADTITSLSGNRDTAGELETALSELSIATDTYRKAQEDAEGSTDALTRAMAQQRKEAQRNTFITFAETLNESSKQLRYYRNEVRKAEEDMARTFRGTDNFWGNASNDAEREIVIKAGFDVNDISIGNLLDMVSRLDEITPEMTGEGKWFKTDSEKAFSRLKSDLQDVAEEIDGYNTALSTLDTNTQRIIESQEAAMSAFADLVSEGSISYTDLIGKMDSETVSLFKTIEEGVERGKGMAADMISVIPQTEEAYGSFAEALKSEMSDIRDEQGLTNEGYWSAYAVLQELIASADELGISLGKVEEQGQKAGDAIVHAGNGSQHSASSSPQDAMDNWLKTIGDNVRLSKVFGNDFNLIQEQISATELAIRSLIEEFNLDEESQQVQYLKGVLGELKDKAQESIDPFKDLGDAVKSAFSADAMGVVLSRSFQALGETVAGAGDRIKELNEETLEYQDKLMEAQEELDDAKARGDEEAIENLEKQIEGYEDVINANKEEKKALESGEEGWKAFGRSALTSLAEVLEGLGSQLAAQAISGLFNPATIGAAALAGVASAAAFAAAVGLRAAAGSFEKGGIVPPVAGVNSYSGDNLIARVNAGELILNRAQQVNLSGYLAALEAQRGLSSPSSPAITINMQGAYIYGLNEPAVGKAIYDNIKTLQYEGVLR